MGSLGFAVDFAGFTPIIGSTISGATYLECIAIYLTDLSSRGLSITASPSPSMAGYPGLIGSQTTSGLLVEYPNRALHGVQGSVTISAANESSLTGTFDVTIQLAEGGVSDPLTGTFTLPSCPNLDSCSLFGC